MKTKLTLAVLFTATAVAVGDAPAQKVGQPPGPPQCYRPWEHAVFRGTGAYAYLDDCVLPDTGNPFLTFATPYLNYNLSGVPEPLPFIPPGDHVGNNDVAPWGDHGPLWFCRWYNALGTVGGFDVFRIGDFTRGREGHVFYFNCLEDVTIQNVNAYQCGAQFAQMVWRPNETTIPPQNWHQQDFTVTIRDCSVIDQGVINTGVAVRASWPISFFNPGQDLVVENLLLDVDIANFFNSSMQGPFNSHGAILCTPGSTVENVTITNPVIRLRRPDRALFRFWGAQNISITGGSVDITAGTRQIDLVDTAGVQTLSIQGMSTTFPILVRILSTSSPWSNPIQTFLYDGSSPLFWSG